MLSRSSTTLFDASLASARAGSSRFSFPSPARFSSLANASVSNECRLEVRAAPRSQIF